MNQRNQRRVVVTGLGVVSPIGNCVEEFWAALCAGRSGVGPITLFDASALRTRIAAEVRGFALTDAVDRHKARRLDRYAQFALNAAVEAWRDAGLEGASLDPYAGGTIIGSSRGGESTVVEQMGRLIRAEGHAPASAYLVTRMLSSMATAQVAMLFGLHGPSFALSSACATGAHAIGEAGEMIRRGDAEVMVCGGAEAPITPLTFAGHDVSSALSRRNDDPTGASRPFDASRDGFVIAEGAAVLVLEEREHALERGRRIHAELAGYAATTDAEHETRPDAEGASLHRAIERALAKAGVAADEVDAVFAHATGTPAGDGAEVRALARSFGERLATLPAPAVKSTLGHALGAAGAMQAVAAILALERGLLPPTSNYTTPDPLCTVDPVTAAARPATLRHVLSNSLGFGGHNAALLFSRL